MKRLQNMIKSFVWFERFNIFPMSTGSRLKASCHSQVKYNNVTRCIIFTRDRYRMNPKSKIQTIYQQY